MPLTLTLHLGGTGKQVTEFEVSLGYIESTWPARTMKQEFFRKWRWGRGRTIWALRVFIPKASLATNSRWVHWPAEQQQQNCPRQGCSDEIQGKRGREF